MRMKILGAGFMALIILLVPLTTAVEEVDVRATNNMIQSADTMITLTSQEITKTINDIQYYLRDKPTFALKVKQAFINSIVVSSDGTKKLDMVKYVNLLKPTVSALLPTTQQMAQAQTSGTQSASISIGIGEMSMNMQQQMAGQLSLDYENIGKYRWNNIVRPILNSLPGINWPTWRTDNDYVDGDGPKLAGEQDKTDYDYYNSKDEGVKYEYHGLDDRFDWNNLAVLLYVAPYFALGLLICLIFFFLIYPIVTIIFIGLDITCLLQEIFDVKDVPYQYPGNTDGF